MRVALYARYSTDQQRPASIEDQLRDCRAYAARMGAHVVSEHEDAATSGATMAGRPGLRALLSQARAGKIDAVIAEHSDRLARSGADTWAIFEDLRSIGVAIHTVAAGEVTAIHTGVAAISSAMLLEEGARKTRRGLEGVVRSGRSGGGLTYGYKIRRELDARGELIRGLREVDKDKAEVVREIFRRYAAGEGPRSIAAALNARQIPGPTGGPWNASTIAGNAARGNGVIHNALYVGEIVWNRQTYRKDRTTGRRRSRLNDPAGVVRTVDEALRIVPAELWDKVRDRHAEASKHGRPKGPGRPKRLLSGLVRCSVCDGRMTLSGPKGALRCQTRVERGPTACANGRSPGYAGLEARVLAAIGEHMLHPALIEAAVQGYHDRMAERRRGSIDERAKKAKELGEVRRGLERLVDLVVAGEIDGKTVGERIRALEIRRDQLEAEIEAAREAEGTVALFPGVANQYRRLIEQLQTLLHDEDPDQQINRLEATEALRALVTAVWFTPLPVHGQYSLELEGDLAPLLGLKTEGEVRLGMVAGAGFEPATFRL